VLKIAYEKKNPHDGDSTLEREKRLATLIKLLDTSLRVILFGAAFMMVLREFGLDITPLLTGAGIAGVALGFGAQSLVKDVISGFFILLEDQIRVGDVIKINNTLAGSVERMELRVTAIRGGDGTLHIIPNGEIKSVSNMTFEFGQALVDIPVNYSEDVNKCHEVFSAVAKEFSKEHEWHPQLKGDAEYIGITKFESNGMMLQIVAKTGPRSRWSIERELRHRVKLAADAAGISLLLGAAPAAPKAE